MYKLIFEHDGSTEAYVSRQWIRRMDGKPEFLSPRPISLAAGEEILKEFNFTEPILIREGEVGDGWIVIGSDETGSMLVKWDGGMHLEINMVGAESVSMLAGIHDIVKEKVSSLVEMTAKDEFPRGFGGVVNFRIDTSPSRRERVNRMFSELEAAPAA